MPERSYIAIDLKSFYASVECVERGLDPLDTMLVVADESRTDKTICLAVTPSLKVLGIGGRPRLFEVVQQVGELNAARRLQAPGRAFTGKSFFASELCGHGELALDYIVAPPRMAYYIEYSTRIFQIYLKYVAPEDIHPYSIDEVFVDCTAYLARAELSAREFAMRMMLDVLQSTGITATAGIGSNLYLCKIAMDILAKHMPPDKNGVRIAELDEESYREQLWDHQPITDFWRVGRGISTCLRAQGMYSMGDIALRSMYDEASIYRLLGVNAELLIDHAWGWEPCTIADIKAYQPESRSLSSGQVLSRPYSVKQARVVVREMVEELALDLVEKSLTAGQAELYIGYDSGNVLQTGACPEGTERDSYGRRVPRPAHGSANLPCRTSSERLIADTFLGLYDRLADAHLTVRHLNLAVGLLAGEEEALLAHAPQQLDMFTDAAAEERRRMAEAEKLAKDKARQQAILCMRKRFGKNAILLGTSFREGATAKERNAQIGGHKA